MKNEKLAFAMSELSPGLIEEAERVKRPRLMRLRTLAAAAACLAVVLAASLAIGSGGEISAFIGGVEIGSSPTAVSLPAVMSLDSRSIGVSIPLELDLKNGAVLTASGGSIEIVSAETGETLDEGTRVSASGSVIVYFSPDSGSESHCELSVRRGGHIAVFSLDNDLLSGIWTVCRTD